MLGAMMMEPGFYHSALGAAVSHWFQPSPYITSVSAPNPSSMISPWGSLEQSHVYMEPHAGIHGPFLHVSTGPWLVELRNITKVQWHLKN